MNKFASSSSIALFIGLVVGACKYPDTAPTGDGDGDTGGVEPSECEDHSDCLYPGLPQCVEGECVECDVGEDYCPTGYSCDSTSGWCVVACPMDGLEPGDDSLEDNDAVLTATSISDGSDFSDLWLCPDDVDYFKFVLSQDAYVSIITNAKPFDGDMDLELTGPSMLSIKSEAKWYGYPRAVEAIHTKVTESGTYVLRAHLANGVGGLQYRLQVRILLAP
jgi:hypothetical protein